MTSAGELVRLDEYPLLTPQSLRTMIYAIISQRQREKLEQDLELDLSYSVPGKARFRVNVYFQRDSIGAAFRLIPFEIKPLQDLGIPPVVQDFARLARGFILKHGYPYPSVFDPDRSVLNGLKLRAPPDTLIFDASGKRVFLQPGPITAKIEPASTFSETSSTATRPRKRFVTPVTESRVIAARSASAARRRAAAKARSARRR